MKVLVTGGGGFLGGAIVRQLLSRGDQVRSFARSDYPSLRKLGVDVVCGDLSDTAAVSNAIGGCDAVIHVAARAGIWGSRQQFWEPNVNGSQNVLDACRSHGIRRLVFTSSPSVVHGDGAIEGGDESLPYPERFLAPYPESKAEAERRILSANDDELTTVALRPHLIWGPHDPQFLPRLIEKSRTGKLALIGDGSNLVDTTYIEDAARAHLLALDRATPDAACAGKPYFITQGSPMPIRHILNGLLNAVGEPKVTRSIPSALAYPLGAALEVSFRMLGKQQEPPMTRFLAHQLSTAHWYDISAAQRDLDYAPAISIAEGLSQLRSWYQNE
ncbi:MAG: 3-beta hydroxysteroid dehydrogenase [Lysobacteraceae bacterium]|nr:MAG: 3-beta hydroxysteroid dehydrogenase [Xanthomonadaceae bacterium]